MSRAKNPLYLMAKPGPAAASAIFDLPRCDRQRPIELLHISLLAFFDLAEAPLPWLSVLRDLLARYKGPSFEISFDRIEERRAVTLRNSAPLIAARQFQTSFAAYLSDAGFPYFGSPLPQPHVTINYRGDGNGSEPIAPIGWRVEDVLLVESVVGQTRHITHGSRALSLAK